MEVKQPLNTDKENLHHLLNLALELSERLYRVLKKHPTFRTKDELAKALGISRSMLFHYEQGNHPVPEQVLRKLVELEIVLGLCDSTTGEPRDGNYSRELFPGDQGSVLRDEPKGENSQNLEFLAKGHIRKIPVIGWAHAGQAASYEEIPQSWQRMIPTDCRDPKAFGVMLEGDSMETRYWDGDLLVLMPSERIHSGCLAVVRLVNDGVLLRRIEIRGDVLRLVPANERYAVDEVSLEQVSWAYPVYGSWSQVWK